MTNERLTQLFNLVKFHSGTSTQSRKPSIQHQHARPCIQLLVDKRYTQVCVNNALTRDLIR